MSETDRKAKEKYKAFKKNPDRFIDKEDILVGAVKEKGADNKVSVAIWINPSVSRLVMVSASYDMSNQIDMYIREMDMALAAKKAKDQDSGLVIPGGNGKNRMGNGV